MNQDFLIYPAIKRIVSTLSWILFACSIFLLGGVLFHGEGIITLQAIAAVCLLLVAPWCILTLLPGRGHPLLRFLGILGILLIPLALFISDIATPLGVTISYWIHAIAGTVPDTTSQSIQRVCFDRMDELSLSQLFYVSVLAVTAWTRTKAYPLFSHKLFLLWGLLGIFNPLLSSLSPILFHYKSPIQETLGMAAIVIPIATLLIPTLFWLLTAKFALLLAWNSPRFAGLPDKETWALKSEEK